LKEDWLASAADGKGSIWLGFFGIVLGRMASLISSRRPAGDTLCDESW